MKNIFNLIKAGSKDFHKEQWEKQNPLGKNFMNPDDYDQDSPGYHIIEVQPNVSYFFKVPGSSYKEAWDKWLGDYSESSPRDSEYFDSEKNYANNIEYWGRAGFEEQDL